ncbi:hypothetical protein EV383_4764 [Pseudonocardia sediminis]|uniref:Small secreted domain DUF320 n=1 Tax=Pseudonocardia sediminis TaxID=1397368 RepID=A0A4Q7V4Z4_PSEST|nr:hypothetical protein [Pseudonocardia sediminis]RZT87833.1 hypothetical protein EV383_4764 [Pseudonocardia sediminis]
MVKKLAVVLAATAATLVALSPLASAAPTPDTDDGPVIGDQDSPNGDKFGLVNLDDVNALNGVNVCPDVTATLGNVLGILGGGNAQTKGDRDISCEALSGN